MNPLVILQAVELAANVGRTIAATCANAKTARTVDQVAGVASGLGSSIETLIEVSALINTAIAEGRDITEAELDGLRAQSEAALAAWRKAGPAFCARQATREMECTTDCPSLAPVGETEGVFSEDAS